MAGISLFEGEKLLMELRPHVLAFWDMYLLWVWVIALSILFIGYSEDMGNIAKSQTSLVTQVIVSFAKPRNIGLLNNVPGASDALFALGKSASKGGDAFDSYSNLVLWLAALLVSAFMVSLFKIELKWIGLMLGVGILGVVLASYLALPLEAAYYICIILGIICILCVDVYRKSHNFFITNMRIVTEVTFTQRLRNELSYDKINNIVLQQDSFGVLFDFGTVIPVTASGLGMGSDFSLASVGAQGNVLGVPVSATAGGGRSVQTPRVRSMYGLYGVPCPTTVMETISRQMHEFVGAPYLRRMTEQLDQIKEKVGDTDGKR